MKFNTQLIRRKPSPHTGSVVVPLYLSSTFEQKSPGETYSDFEYSRGGNPTRQRLEDTLANIENGKRGFAFGSGMAAIDSVLRLLSPGDEIITSKDLYGGTYRIFVDFFEKYGLKFTFAGSNEVDAIQEAITEKTKLIWIESPTNPLLKLVDIEAVAKLTAGTDILLAVDNTFASPYIQKPLDLGADIVIHSATKYLGGHSDVVAGIVTCKAEELCERLYFVQNACGAILGPHDSFLILRGIRTLSVRLQRHCENALKVAQFLEQHPAVGQVFYPGLSCHPQHDLACRQMNDFGGVVSFKFVSGKKEDAFAFLKKLRIFILADSLGGVESLANYSATMTHADVPEEKRKELGITEDLIRLSIGIEDIDDLLDDLKQALEASRHEPKEKEVLTY